MGDKTRLSLRLVKENGNDVLGAWTTDIDQEQEIGRTLAALGAAHQIYNLLSGTVDPVPADEDACMSPADIDDLVVAQLPDDTVRMHRRDAQRLADLLLRQRHFERVTRCAARDGKAPAKFNNGVGEPARGRPLADIDDPLPKYRGIDQRVAPKHFGNVRVCPRQGAQRSVTDKSERRWGHRDEIVVHPVQMQALEVGNFPGNMDRENLLLAADGRFGADAEPFDNKTAFRRSTAIGCNRPSGLPMANVNRKRADCGDIRVI